ncbi:hypothetical protein CO662_32870 [Rhizobium anhuiense]|uniref:AprE-like beta-barrel domain-containing protein n=1 Tax=Rhizobium anhuiense TaxID=1184720 RepID=A0ABX4IY53_9HYPH|nr:HlyD family efflux transporter periplasmic adaptor subunit [Rhizobium anhuiense]PDS40862.1 hypothetical protein CO668_32035 [Rhizobium anhuiense]PDS47834.1 hypothetical protein CO662_32870 [Rhizobium anhuiense]
MTERPLFRSETVAEIENTLSRVYLDRDVARGWELYAFVTCVVAALASLLLVRVSLDATAVGIFRANANNRVIVADRDGILGYTISNRLPVDVTKGEKIATIKNFDPVTLRQAPNIEFNRTELSARRVRVVARQQAAREAMKSKIDNLRLMQAQLQTLAKDTDNLIAVYQDDIARLSKREANYRKMLEQGLITSQILENASENVAERNFQLNAAQTNKHEYERRSTEIEYQLQQAADDGAKEQLDLENQLTAIDVAIKADAELEERPLFAEDGVTLIPKGYSSGQAVKRGDVLFEVGAKADYLEIEADVPDSQIGELRDGMPVTISVNSYPFFKYGMINGTVAFVSTVATDAVAFSEKLPTNSQFRMIIRPDPASIAAFSRDKRLLPGMLTEVHVRKDTVAIWRLLFSPLLHLGTRTDI